ncbi:MAG: Cof-type HAD-IIB family hydrolase [Lachnospiraceae bacterium]|nr:Cof-type HAD-IIB family hydrolase [Lachnospiraceae bacterium]
MYKLAVTDIDGTLVDSKGNISQKTLQTIKKVTDRGIPFTVCTGRNITKAMPIAKKLGLKVPFVCIDGILIYDPVVGKPVLDMSMSRENVKKIVKLGAERNTFIEVSDGYKYYKYLPTKAHRKYDCFNKHNFTGRVKSYMGGIRYVNSPDELCQVKGPIYQVVIGAEDEITREITSIVRNQGYQSIEVRDLLWKEFLFINHQGMGKARGVKLLCDYFKISPKEVIAFGDERNDIDMLELVGMGVAMDNADESVKAVADYVTLSNDNDGVAEALSKFFL